MTYSNCKFEETYQNQFLFGTSCSPYALGEDLPMEEWERDLLQMKAMDFNTVRIFVTWSRIESQKDRYDFSKVDNFFDLAQKHGMRVIINFGGMFGNACGFSRPWYLRNLQDYCNDNPTVAERAELFMRKVIERYRSRENLVGWMIWNEPNNTAHCKCPHTMRYFRQWLQEKYGNISALNTAWAGGEPVCFENFDEIDKVAGHGMAGKLDMERFQQWNLQRRMLRIHQLVQELDPAQRFTTTNIVHHLAATEGLENSMTSGLNLEQMGEAVSMMGVSCYIAEHRYDLQPAWKVAYKLSRHRCVSSDQHRRMLLLETGTGPNIRQMSISGRNALMWQNIAHNVKGLLMWNYRSRLDAEQVALHHMMAFDGTLTERGADIAALSKVLQKNAALLNSVYPAPEAAVLTLEDTMLLQGLNYGIGSIHSPLDYERVQQSRFGAYKLLWDMKINADCLTENRLNTLNRYKVLLLPAQEQMTEELAAALEAYVDQGGTVIAESPVGFRNREGRLIYRAPGHGMDAVFGCWLNDRQNGTVAPLITMPDGSEVPVCDFFSVLNPTTAEVLCRYSGSNGAAVTINSYGKGSVICAGTEIFRQYATQPQEAMTAMMQQWIRESGILPDLALEGETEHVEAVRMAGEDQVLYLLINHSDEPANVRVQLRETAGVAVNIIDGAEYSLSFERCLQPWETLALRIG